MDPCDRLGKAPQATAIWYAGGFPTEPVDPLPEHFGNKRPFVTNDADRFRIALLTPGLREEVEPFFAVALALRERVHIVCLPTSPDNIGFCKSAHVEAVASFPGEEAAQTALVPLADPKVDEVQPTFSERSLLQLLDDAGLCAWSNFTGRPPCPRTSPVATLGHVAKLNRRDRFSARSVEPSIAHQQTGGCA